MIVVVMIGLLAAIAIPAFQKIRDTSRVNATLSDLRVLYYGFETYSLESGSWPVDTASGVMPTEMIGIIPESLFEAPTPLGGFWDWDNHPDHGIVGISLVQSDVRVIREDLVIKAEEKMDGQGMEDGRFRTVPEFDWSVITYILEDLSSP